MITAKENDDDEDEDSSAYPEEVLTVLRGLTEGEVASDIIETDTGYYVVRLDKVLDEDATASKRESLQSSKEEDYYTETTDGWLDDADVKEVKKVLKTLKITDSHTFTAPTATPTPSPEATPEVTEEPEATETPAATETPEATETPAPTATQAAK